MILFFIGCGGGITTTENNSRLNVDNYVNVAQYYYVTQLKNKKDGIKDKRYRAYPAETQADRDISDSFEVIVKAPDNYLKELRVNYHKNSVLLDTKPNTNSIIVTFLEDGDQKESSTFTLEEFVNFGIEDQYKRVL
jgi:hypothetical protein